MCRLEQDCGRAGQLLALRRASAADVEPRQPSASAAVPAAWLWRAEGPTEWLSRGCGHEERAGAVSSAEGSQCVAVPFLTTSFRYPGLSPALFGMEPWDSEVLGVPALPPALADRMPEPTLGLSTGQVRRTSGLPFLLFLLFCLTHPTGCRCTSHPAPPTCACPAPAPAKP